MAKAKGERRSFNNVDLTTAQVMALKGRANAIPKVTIRVGSQTFDLPVEAQLLKSASGFYFLSVPPINAVCALDGNGRHQPIHADEKADAIRSFSANRTKARPSITKAAIPGALAEALKQVPKGYKLVIDGDGYRLAKTRK